MPTRRDASRMSYGPVPVGQDRSDVSPFAREAGRGPQASLRNSPLCDRVRGDLAGQCPAGSLRGTREVFLCWEEGEEDIEHWHELDTGFDGREKL